MHCLPCNTCKDITASHFHCPFCSISVKRKHDFERHLERKHATPSMPQSTSHKSLPEQSKTSAGDKSITDPKCAICQKVFKSWSSQRRHMNECHGRDTKCYGKCVDPVRGIYFVYSIERNSTNYPVHVQRKVVGLERNIQCEVDKCSSLAMALGRSGQPGYECPHLQAVKHAELFIDEWSLTDPKLEEMVSMNWISPKRSDECRNFLQDIQSKGICPIQPLLSNQNSRLVHFSVACNDKNEYWGKLGRVKVTFDKNDGNWMCDCCKNVNQKRSCSHKYLAKWFVHENMPHVIKSVKESKTAFRDIPDEDEKILEDGHTQNAIESDESETRIRRETAYPMTEKLYPLPIPDSVKYNDLCHIGELIPLEDECCFCSSRPKLGKPVLVNKHAKVLGLQGLVKDVAVFHKICSRCGFSFRYQEWADGLHNLLIICFVLFMIMDLPYICDHQVGYSAGGYSLSPRWFLTWYIYPFFQD